MSCASPFFLPLRSAPSVSSERIKATRRLVCNGKTVLCSLSVGGNLRVAGGTAGYVLTNQGDGVTRWAPAAGGPGLNFADAFVSSTETEAESGTPVFATVEAAVAAGASQIDILDDVTSTTPIDIGATDTFIRIRENVTWTITAASWTAAGNTGSLAVQGGSVSVATGAAFSLGSAVEELLLLGTTLSNGSAGTSIALDPATRLLMENVVVENNARAFTMAASAEVSLQDVQFTTASPAPEVVTDGSAVVSHVRGGPDFLVTTTGGTVDIRGSVFGDLSIAATTDAELTVAGNQVTGTLDLSGAAAYGGQVTDNAIGAFALSAAGGSLPSTSILSNNVISGTTTFTGTMTSNTIEANALAGLVTFSGLVSLTALSGNFFGAGVTFTHDAFSPLLTGNFVIGDMLFTAAGTSLSSGIFRGNLVIGALTFAADCDGTIFTDNVLAGNVLITGDSTGSEWLANSVEGTFTVGDTTVVNFHDNHIYEALVINSVLSSGHFDGNLFDSLTVTTTTTGGVFTGNQMDATLTGDVRGCLFSNNLAGTIGCGADVIQTVFSGNEILVSLSVAGGFEESVMTGNMIVTGTTTFTGTWSMSVFTSNYVEFTPLTFGAVADCALADNIFGALVSVTFSSTFTDSTFEGNRLSLATGTALTFTDAVLRSVVSANNLLTGDVAFSSTFTSSNFEGNHLRDVTFTGDPFRFTLSGNTLRSATFSGGADIGVIAGNNFDNTVGVDPMTFAADADSLTVTGNNTTGGGGDVVRFSGDVSSLIFSDNEANLEVLGDAEGTVTGNHGSLDLRGLTSGSSITGNQVATVCFFNSMSESTFSSNQLDVALTMTLTFVDCTISSNHVTPAMTLVSLTRCTVTGNTVEGPITISTASADCTYTGNVCTAITFSGAAGTTATNCISNNRVIGGAITAGATVSAGDNIVTGNHATGAFSGWTTSPTTPNELMSDGGAVFTAASGMNRLP